MEKIRNYFAPFASYLYRGRVIRMAFGFDNTITWSAASDGDTVRVGSTQGIRAESNSTGDFIVDLSGIGTIETDFLKSLLRIARNLDGESRRLVLRNPELEVERLLVLAGFLHLSNAVVLEHQL